MLHMCSICLAIYNQFSNATGGESTWLVKVYDVALKIYYDDPTYHVNQHVKSGKVTVKDGNVTIKSGPTGLPGGPKDVEG